MLNDVPEEYVRKLRAAEDLASRLQKPDWATKANLEKLRAFVREALDFVQGNNVPGKRKRLDALGHASGELENIHDLGTLDAKWRLESVFFALRVARTGRGTVMAT